MLAGKFSTIVSLNKYETTWYNSVFIPVWNTLKDEYATSANLYSHDIFRNIKLVMYLTYKCSNVEYNNVTMQKALTAHKLLLS